jgi:hypothetical protein
VAISVVYGQVRAHSRSYSWVAPAALRWISNRQPIMITWSQITFCLRGHRLHCLLPIVMAEVSSSLAVSTVPLVIAVLVLAVGSQSFV